jgi:hypothetical protein
MPALLTNIRQALERSVTRENALAYFVASSATKKKRFLTDTSSDHPSSVRRRTGDETSRSENKLDSWSFGNKSFFVIKQPSLL